MTDHIQIHGQSHDQWQSAVGWDREVWADPQARKQLHSYITLQLAANGLLANLEGIEPALSQYSQGLLENLREKNRLLAGQKAPIDRRIEEFLSRYFADQQLSEPLSLPARALVLDRHGMAREMSVPAGGDVFKNRYVESHRCFNGVLNNPVRDRRTTAGTFHVVDGGMGVPGDKRIVPKSAFVKLMRTAIQPPRDLMVVPFTAELAVPAHSWVSLLLRPLVCPEVAGYCRAKTMETRFFVPGSLISNLDFVESIFGNAGDPLIAEKRCRVGR